MRSPNISGADVRCSRRFAEVPIHKVCIRDETNIRNPPRRAAEGKVAGCVRAALFNRIRRSIVDSRRFQVRRFRELHLHHSLRVH
jgi:hypothetical protein